MVKKLCAFLLILLLPLTALASDGRVFDNSRLFSADEEAVLEAQILQLRQKHDMDFVVLTDSGAEYAEEDWEAEQNSLHFADRFYEKGGFGHGKEESGFMFFIDMSNRMPTVYTYGEMIDYVDDERLGDLLDRVYAYLRSGNYAGAAQLALQMADSFVKQGIPEGNYRYDYLTGQVLTARHKALTDKELAMALLAAIVAAVIAMRSVTSRYKLKGGAYSYDVDANTRMTLLDHEDTYVNSTVRTVRIPKGPPPGSGGGSGGGTRIHSSGGRSFGGGSGRRF